MMKSYIIIVKRQTGDFPGIHLPMQGSRVRSLVWEDPTCRGATKPVCRNYWACALEPASHNYWARVLQLLKPRHLEPMLRNKKSHCSARFGSTYTKIGKIQRRLAWPLRKDDTQIREAFHIFKQPHSTGRSAQCFVTTERGGIGRVGGRCKREEIWGHMYMYSWFTLL